MWLRASRIPAPGLSRLGPVLQDVLHWFAKMLEPGGADLCTGPRGRFQSPDTDAVAQARRVFCVPLPTLLNLAGESLVEQAEDRSGQQNDERPNHAPDHPL